jgi:hypothetical protein
MERLVKSKKFKVENYYEAPACLVCDGIYSIKEGKIDVQRLTQKHRCAKCGDMIILDSVDFPQVKARILEEIK